MEGRTPFGLQYNDDDKKNLHFMFIDPLVGFNKDAHLAPGSHAQRYSMYFEVFFGQVCTFF